MRSKARKLSSVGAFATILATAVAASAATPTTISNFGASMSGASVRVSGTAAFGGQDPVLVSEDGTGDNLGGAQTGALGLDIDKLYISQPSSSVNSLLFTIQLAGLQGGGIREAFQYNWDIAVDGGAEAGGDNWSIKSMRSGQGSQIGNQGPWAALTRCVIDPSSPTGGYTCSTTTPLLAVTYDETAAQIRITVPLNRIGATPGSTIDAWPRNGAPVWIRTSVAGAQTGFVTVDDTAHDQFTVPKKMVDVGLVLPGDPATFTNSASVAANGGFVGMIDNPAPGTYDAVARACFGENCTIASTPFTVA